MPLTRFGAVDRVSRAASLERVNLIVVSAVCFERPDGRVLTVRKRGTDAFMLPGGKPEPGETALACALREVHEELGLTISSGEVTLLGTFATRAANETGFALRATVYRTAVPIEPAVHAELDELRWIDPATGINDPREAPLNREHVFPLLVAERRASGAKPASDAGDAAVHKRISPAAASRPSGASSPA